MFIVMFDDQCGLEYAFSHSDECEGALLWSTKNEIAGFKTRTDAQRAIRISQRWAALQESQGFMVDKAFLPCNRKFLKIVRVMVKNEAGE